MKPKKSRVRIAKINLGTVELNVPITEIGSGAKSKWRKLGFDTTYIIDSKESVKRGFLETMGQTVLERNSAYVCIEIPFPDILKESDIDSLTTGIIKATNSLDLSITGQKKVKLKKVKTDLARSNMCGMFTPAITPQRKIEKGEKIGEIFDPYTIKAVDVINDFSGRLWVIKRQGFVRIGEFLYEVAYKV